MSHLRVEKRKQKRNAPQHFCAAGCSTTTGYRRSGLWILWLIGRPTYLCQSCKDSWEITYNRALLNDWTVA